MEDDYYAILGIPRTATAEEIKKAFKNKARQYHPDKGGDPEMFKKINEAYEVLSDEQKRSHYNQFGKNPPQMPDHPFPDIFQMFGRRHGNQERQTEDRSLSLELSLEEAYKGTTIKFRHKRKIYVGHPEKCASCNGTGNIVERMSTNMGIFQNVRVCDKCTGIGILLRENQFQTKSEISDIVVHPHSVFGSTIILQGKADEIPGMKTGNIILELTPIPHPVFELVQGFHLLCTLKIHPVEAMTRFTREIVLPSGEKLVIGHDDDSPFFSLLEKARKIRKRGMFHSSGEKGDLLIKFVLSDYRFPYPDLLLQNLQEPLPDFEPDHIPLSMIDVLDTSKPPQQTRSHPRPHVQECRQS